MVDSIKSLKDRILKLERRVTLLENKKEKTKARPKLKVVKESVIDILKGFKNSGFFKKPKSFSEIIKKLEQEGRYYNRTSLSKPLLTLVKKKILGRIGERGNWKYVSR